MPDRVDVTPTCERSYGDIENLARLLWLLARLSEDDEPPVAVGGWDEADDGMRDEFRATAYDMARALAGDNPEEILRHAG